MLDEIVIFLSRADLEARGIPASRATLWRRVKAGTFPPPVKLGSRRNGWPADEIDAWQKARLAERGAIVAA